MNAAAPHKAAARAAPATQRRLAWLWLAFVGIAFALLLVFVLVLEEVIDKDVLGLDEPVRAWVLAHTTTGFTRLFSAITLLGGLFGNAAVGVVGVLWLWLRQRRVIAAVFATTPLVAGILFGVLKQVMERRRPGGILASIGSYAFPSGHTTVSTALWVTLMYLLRREGVLGRPLAITFAAGVPLLIGFTRTYLDAHWATDVIGGWLLGLGIAAIGIALYERLR